jgi:hypothetical protein
MFEKVRHEVLYLTAALVLACTASQAGVIARIERPAPYDLRVVGFELPRDAAVRIEAQGVGFRGTSTFGLWRWTDPDDEATRIAYAWLLDTGTREPVWIMDPATSERDKDNPYLFRADHRIDLPAGRYELYYFSGVEWFAGDGSEEPAEQSWWSSVFGRDRPSPKQLGEALGAGYASVSSEGLSERDAPAFDVTGAIPGALILHQQLGDSTLRVSGFTLERAAYLRLYGLVEKAETWQTSSDFGWIVDATTREIVWDSNTADLKEAGGATKNRKFDEQLGLEPGRYVVYFGTDLSHSYAHFNAPPPYDPLNWGITILPGRDFAAASFGAFDPSKDDEPLIEITEVGADQSIDRAFRLSGPGVLQVLALGEYDGDEERFYDHGWISDASTGKTVWRMTGRNTMDAGGAKKNRRFDGLVELPAGEYVVHYVTDGSHSFDQWNEEAPFEPERWGITIRAGSGFDRALFELE